MDEGEVVPIALVVSLIGNQQIEIAVLKGKLARALEENENLRRLADLKAELSTPGSTDPA